LNARGIVAPVSIAAVRVIVSNGSAYLNKNVQSAIPGAKDARQKQLGSRNEIGNYAEGTQPDFKGT